MSMSNSVAVESVESGHVFSQRGAIVLEVPCPHQQRGFPVCGLVRQYSWRGQLWSDEAMTATTWADSLRKCHAHYNINALYNAFVHIDTRGHITHTPTHTDTHTRRQMKQRIVWALLFSAVSLGLPVVRSCFGFSSDALVERGALCLAR